MFLAPELRPVFARRLHADRGWGRPWLHRPRTTRRLRHVKRCRGGRGPAGCGKGPQLPGSAGGSDDGGLEAVRLLTASVVAVPPGAGGGSCAAGHAVGADPGCGGQAGRLISQSMLDIVSIEADQEAGQWLPPSGRNWKKSEPAAVCRRGDHGNVPAAARQGRGPQPPGPPLRQRERHARGQGCDAAAPEPAVPGAAVFRGTR